MTSSNSYRNEFDQWVALAGQDPAAFEKLRLSLIERAIRDAPPERRQRLWTLQWRIDRERARAGSPLGACMRISRMMWDKVLAPGGFLECLERIPGHRSTRQPKAPRLAPVIPITRGKRRSADGQQS